MSRTRTVVLSFVTLVWVLAVAAPARPDGGIVGGKAINKLTVPFSGIVNGPSEDIAITGNVLVKTIHTPGFPDKMVSTSYKVAPGGTGVGMTSRQTYTLKGSAKFKYFIPGAAYPTQISHTSPFIKLVPDTRIGQNQTVQLTVRGNPTGITLNYDGSGVVTSAVASIQAQPTLGSCTQVVEVCN